MGKLKLGADIEFAVFDYMSACFVEAGDIIGQSGKIGCDGSGEQLEIRPSPRAATADGIKELVEQQRKLMRQFLVSHIPYMLSAGGYPSDIPCGFHIHIDKPSYVLSYEKWVHLLSNTVGAAILMLEHPVKDALRRQSTSYGGLLDFRVTTHRGKDCIEYRCPHSPPSPEAAEALYALSAIATAIYPKQTANRHFPQARTSKRKCAEYLSKLAAKHAKIFEDYEENLTALFGAIVNAVAGKKCCWWKRDDPLENTEMLTLTHDYWNLPRKPRFTPTIIGNDGDYKVPDILHTLYEKYGPVTTSSPVYVYGLVNDSRPDISVRINNLDATNAHPLASKLRQILHGAGISSVEFGRSYGERATQHPVAIGIRLSVRKKKSADELAELIYKVLSEAGLINTRRKVRRRKQPLRKIDFSEFKRRLKIREAPAEQGITHQQTQSSVKRRISKLVRPDVSHPDNSRAIERGIVLRDQVSFVERNELDYDVSQYSVVRAFVVNGHKVIYADGGWFCECEYFRYRTGPSGSPLGCKHIFAVLASGEVNGQYLGELCNQNLYKAERTEVNTVSENV